MTARCERSTKRCSESWLQRSVCRGRKRVRGRAGVQAQRTLEELALAQMENRVFSKTLDALHTEVSRERATGRSCAISSRSATTSSARPSSRPTDWPRPADNTRRRVRSHLVMPISSRRPACPAHRPCTVSAHAAARSLGDEGGPALVPGGVALVRRLGDLRAFSPRCLSPPSRGRRARTAAERSRAGGEPCHMEAGEPRPHSISSQPAPRAPIRFVGFGSSRLSTNSAVPGNSAGYGNLGGFACAYDVIRAKMFTSESCAGSPVVHGGVPVIISISKMPSCHQSCRTCGPAPTPARARGSTAARAVVGEPRDGVHVLGEAEVHQHDVAALVDRHAERHCCGTPRSSRGARRAPTRRTRRRTWRRPRRSCRPPSAPRARTSRAS